MNSRRVYFIPAILIFVLLLLFPLSFFNRPNILKESLQVQILENLYRPLDVIFMHLYFVPEKLPLYEIEVGKKDLQRLYDSLPQTSDKAEVFKKRYLEDRVYIPASLKIGGTTYKAEMTVRGGVPHHFMGEKKSLRLKLEKGQMAPFSSINLIVPEDGNFIDSYVSEMLGNNLGLFMFKGDYVNVAIGGVKMGVFQSLQDEADSGVVEIGKLSTNDVILREEISPQIIADGGPSNLFEDSGIWKTANKPEDNDAMPLSAIFKLKRVYAMNDQDFYKNLEETIDMEQFLKFLAHNFIMGDFHQGNDSNQVLLFLKEKSRIWFVPDENNIFPVEKLQGLHYNVFFERVINRPEYFWKRNSILWNLVNDEQFQDDLERGLDGLYNNIKASIYQDEKKAFRFLAFRSKVNSQKSILSNNFKKIKTYFEDYYIESNNVLNPVYALGNRPLAMINVRVNSYFQPQIKNIDLSFADEVDSNIKVVYDLNENEQVDDGDEILSEFDVNNSKDFIKTIDQPLLAISFVENPIDKIKPTIISKLLVVSDKKVSLDKLQINFTNSITGAALVSVNNLVDGSFFQEKPMTPNFVKVVGRGKYLISQGSYVVDDDVFVPEGEIEIQAGTKLLFQPGKSFITRSRVLARGSEQKPIVFTAVNKNKPWGSFLIVGQGSGENIFDFAQFSYASGLKGYGYTATGGLAVHFGDAIITNSSFAYSNDDDALNIKHGYGVVSGNTFEKNKSDAIDFDSVSGVVENNIFNDNGGDGVDTSFSKVLVKNNEIARSGDKCTSVGEKSDVEIVSNVLRECDIGVAVKDGSKAKVVDNTLLNNRVALSAYMKKPIYIEGGIISLGFNKFEGNQKREETDDKSKIIFFNIRSLLLWRKDGNGQLF